jgi:hypothetical protein
MKSYHYNEQTINEGDASVVTVTEEQIIKEYYPWWEEQMIKKFGIGHYLITPEKCIEDWVVVNWAWESEWK